MNLELKEKIIESLKRIPGISKKQANKIVVFFLENKLQNTKELFEDIIILKNETKTCSQCLAYAKQEICDICSDSKRNKKIFVVQDSLDIEKIESLDIEKGKYFVFSDSINLKQIRNETLEKIDHLLKVVAKNEEIILALNTDLNGQITMKYLEKRIRDEFKNKNVYQLSIGIPFGMAIESVDAISLKQAILNKRKI
ncbi:toprim domain-containing protein [Mycoplasmopsis arginini]|uniref:toprim domain-containing protein n=1 Tax=Mycoplasmopsis arginini TaxID=2094 RepID=UPI0035144D54